MKTLTPVANAGLPTKPVKNRKAKMVALFFALTMGILKSKKMPRPTIYTGFLPIDGISWRGVRNIGPTP